jgi:ribosome-associated heat shock protein Hsp15
MDNSGEALRIDKWLWAARFFKTRSMAAQAVTGGKVHLNGNRVKAAHPVKIDDKLVIGCGLEEFRVTVLALAALRRPASEARLLYIEAEESIRTREEQRELRKLANAGHHPPATRPSKRDRRKIKAFIRND